MLGILYTIIFFLELDLEFFLSSLTDANILVWRSRLSGVARVSLSVHESHLKSYAAKGSLHE